jgi:hypothetical protein
VASTSEQAVIGLNASARRLGERERELETFYRYLYHSAV